MLRLIVPSLLAMAIGCAESGPPPVPKPATLAIKNRSQFQLDEVRLHSGPSFVGVPNLLRAPMAIDATITTTVTGDVNLTVIRARYLGGPMVALTTEEPLELVDGGIFDISVFDDSFRAEARR
ncbi:MAG: hypothetical protein U1E65_06775 [Myxococcota bacterium]